MNVFLEEFEYYLDFHCVLIFNAIIHNEDIGWYCKRIRGQTFIYG